MSGYTTVEVVRLTGVSYRRLDYWDRIDVVSPSLKRAYGSGSQRLYSDEDVAKVACIARLQQAGVELQAIRERTPEGTLEALRDMLEEMGYVEVADGNR